MSDKKIVVVYLISGKKVFFNSIQFLPNGDITGVKTSKEGRIANVVVPSKSIDYTESWQ